MKDTSRTVCCKKTVIAAIIAFVAGLLVMLIALEVVIPWITAPKASDFGTVPAEIAPNTAEWFAYDRIYSDKHALVEVTCNENPAKLVEDANFESGLGWFYTFFYTEKNGIDFYPETYEETFFSEGQVGSTFTYTADDMTIWWGESRVAANGQVIARGGMPDQNVSGLGIKISGKDSTGEALDFYGYLEFSHEIKE